MSDNHHLFLRGSVLRSSFLWLITLALESNAIGDVTADPVVIGQSGTFYIDTIDGAQYYFDPADTYMLVNESVEIDGKVYSFNADGVFTHYGAHVDKNGDGKCEACTVKSPFWSFLQMLISFFRKIKAFFMSLFG